MNMFDATAYHELFGMGKYDTDKSDTMNSMDMHDMDGMYMNDMSDTDMRKDDRHNMDSLTPFPKNTSVAMAYVPYQEWEKPYTDSVALSRGTMFPCLDKPYIGEEAVKHGRKR